VLGPVLAAAATAEAGCRLLAPRQPLPAPVDVRLTDHFSPDEVQRGRRYARPQLALGLARGAIDLASLALLVARPPGWLGRLDAQPVPGAAAAAAGLTAAMALPTLPLRVISRRRAQAVGLDTQSWGGWASDLAKASAISSLMAGALGAGLAALIRRSPGSWWRPAAGATVGLGTVVAALAPLVLDPIFNHFEPLPEGETRTDVLELAQAAQVRVREVYSVDASRRTTAANAYVTGLGPTKRVVLFDTLLDRYTRDEIRLVVAHELGHVRHRDVPRGVVYAAIVAPATTYAIQQLGGVLRAPNAGGRLTGRASDLPALALAAALVSAPVSIIGNRLSRAIERQADAFSLRLVPAPDAFVSFERRIALQNVADLDPPGWLTALIATHPPTAQRIGAALAAA
jgi:STE24 endopeptidase